MLVLMTYHFAEIFLTLRHQDLWCWLCWKFVWRCWVVGVNELQSYLQVAHHQDVHFCVKGCNYVSWCFPSAESVMRKSILLIIAGFFFRRLLFDEKEGSVMFTICPPPPSPTLLFPWLLPLNGFLFGGFAFFWLAKIFWSNTDAQRICHIFLVCILFKAFQVLHDNIYEDKQTTTKQYF